MDFNASAALPPGKEHTVRHEYELFGPRAGQDILKKRNIRGVIDK